MPILHVFAGIPTADFASSLPWYERFFGRPPDRFPTEGEAVWQLTETGHVYLVADAGRAGHSLLTLIVDDLDERVQALAGRGIASELEAMPGVGRRAKVVDPDGNAIALAQLVSAD